MVGAVSNSGLGFGVEFTLEDGFSTPAKAIQNSMNSMVGSMDMLRAGAATMAAGLAVLVPAKMGLQISGEFEQARVGLLTFLKSQEEVDRVFKNIQADALKAAAFDTQDLLEVNSALISAGISADRARRDTNNLANAVAAAGKGGAELRRMASNMQQIQNAGKATTMDIKQFAYAGINIYGLLADYTGKTVAQVKDLDISYEDLTNALDKAGKAGGMYYGASERQSKTLFGQLSNLQDSWKFFLAGIGDALAPVVGVAVQGLTAIANKLKEITNSPMGAMAVRAVVAMGLITAAVGLWVVISNTAIVTNGVLAASFGAVMSTLLPVIAIAGLIAMAVSSMNDQTKEAIRNFASMVGSGIADFFSKIGKIVQFVVEVWTTFDGKTVTLSEDFADLSEGMQTLGIYVIKLRQLFSGFTDGLVFALTTTWEVIKAFGTLVGWVVELIGGLLSLLGLWRNTEEGLNSVEIAGRGLGNVIGFLIGGFVLLQGVIMVGRGLMAAYTVVTNIATAAQWALNAALFVMEAPILVIIAIVAALALIVYSVYENWDKIVTAFREGGILAGIKAIGIAILDSILLPFQKVLELASNLPGSMGEWAAAGASSIQNFRNSMGDTPTADAVPTASPVPTYSAMPKYTRTDGGSNRVTNNNTTVQPTHTKATVVNQIHLDGKLITEHVMDNIALTEARRG